MSWSKQALVIASQVERYTSIRSSTYGVVFFATPHRGSAGIPLGKVAAQIVRAVYAMPTINFLEAVERDSIFASTQIDDFRRQSGNLNVLSFFETRASPNMGIVSRVDGEV
jgi:hypothetical protein